MYLNLDPEKFSRPLRFVWLQSSEGEDWETALKSELRRHELSRVTSTRIYLAVEETIKRIGNEKFRRHFEIKYISIARSFALTELRWNFRNQGSEFPLRLYASLSIEEAIIFGLCFRVKRIAATQQETVAAQNADIEQALQILRGSSDLKKHWFDKE